MELKQNEQFLKKAYNKALIPCILSVLSGNINILADGILVGQRLGAPALAAINFSLPGVPCFVYRGFVRRIRNGYPRVGGYRKKPREAGAKSLPYVDFLVCGSFGYNNNFRFVISETVVAFSVFR